LGYPVKVSNRLASICTLYGRLPQGAPTSPALANIVFSPIDQELLDLADGWECKYTRYADDIVISGGKYFKKEDLSKVAEIIERSAFKINREKSRIVGSGSRQIVAGLVINKKELPPRKKRMQWRAMFHQASLNPKKYCEEGLKLLGISSFINQYDSHISKNYKQIAQKVIALSSK
jgi:RNA-directed DNA polymerase